MDDPPQFVKDAVAILIYIELFMLSVIVAWSVRRSRHGITKRSKNNEARETPPNQKARRQEGESPGASKAPPDQ